MDTLGSRIRAARESSGLSLGDVGKSLNVNRSTVLRWETGEIGVSSEHLIALAALLEVSDRETLVFGPKIGKHRSRGGKRRHRVEARS